MASLTTSGHAQVNGLNMYYEIHGEGVVPLVLIHGGGSTIESTFGNMLPLLAPYGKIIAVELQAHGRTSDRNAPESFTQDADDVAGLLKYLGFAKANILGFSNGGSTALQTAIRHSELVNKIVSISGASKREGFIPGFFEGMPHATLDHMPASLHADYLRVNPGNHTGLLNMFNKDKQRMMDFKDWPDEELQSIKAPALIMAADQDVVMAEHQVAMARLIAGARIAILPGSHASIVGESTTGEKDSRLLGLIAELILQFLNT